MKPRPPTTEDAKLLRQILRMNGVIIAAYDGKVIHYAVAVKGGAAHSCIQLTLPQKIGPYNIRPWTEAQRARERKAARKRGRHG